MFDSSRDALFRIRTALDWAPDWIVALVILGLSVIFALGVHAIARRLLHRVFGKRPYTTSVLTAIEGPTRLALMVLGIGIALPTAPLDPGTSQIVVKLLLLTVIGLIGWTVVRALNTAASLYLLRFRIDTDDNLLARKHLTQVRILMRTADVLILIVTISAGLMTFDAVRQYGVSLFASAGVAGLVVGLAARPVLSNLLAGVQLAVTQPIRIDDVVVVEKEFGWVEEITATYVVLRLWDWRRMVVPLTYFIEKPFQNWTREGSELIGTIMLYLDYAAPIGLIREKAKEITGQSTLWNGKVFNVQVTEATQDTIEVRILVSANSAPATWDLRCDVREKLLAFIAGECPQALPQQRQTNRRDPRDVGAQREQPAPAPANLEDRTPRLSSARGTRD